MTIISVAACIVFHSALLAAPVPQRLEEVQLPADCTPVRLPAAHAKSFNLSARLAGLPIVGKAQRICRTRQRYEDVAGQLARSLRPRDQPVGMHGIERGIKDARARKVLAGAPTDVVHYVSPEIDLYSWFAKAPDGDLLALELTLGVVYDSREIQIVINEFHFAEREVPIPSAKELGAPVYPGAKYDREAPLRPGCAAMVQHAFYTPDAFGKVALWYADVPSLKPAPNARRATFEGRGDGLDAAVKVELMEDEEGGGTRIALCVRVDMPE